MLRMAGNSILGLCLVLSGCATVPAPAPKPLAGDARLAAGDYRAAIAAYDQFLQAEPNDPAAPRVRATRAVVDQMLEAAAVVPGLAREATLREAELEDAKRELGTLRDKVAALTSTLDQLSALVLEIDRQKTRRETELTRTKNELAALQAELSQLTDVLERLKEADLRAEKRTVKPVLDPPPPEPPSQKN
jgi:tetratricopeptide (TPR) repeat protein